MTRSVRSLLTVAGALLMSLALGVPALAEAQGDSEKGAKVWRRCASCHAVGPKAKHKRGPHLNGVFGRRAASMKGFSYSKAMRGAGANGLVWSYKSLGDFLESPKAIVSKTNMKFKGLSDAEDRAHLLAYLRRFSDDPRDIPESAPTAQGTDHEVDPTILSLQGDPEYGQYLSSECVSCHRVDGEDQGIPSITGWPPEDFVRAMHAYKDKARPHPVMQMMAGRLSNEEIAGLAAFFEGVGKKENN